MNPGLIIFPTLVVALSLACHALIKRYLLAVVVAAGLAVAIFQLVVLATDKVMDPLIFIAVMTTSALVLVGAALIGLPFVLYRSRKGTTSG